MYLGAAEAPVQQYACSFWVLKGSSNIYVSLDSHTHRNSDIYTPCAYCYRQSWLKLCLGCQPSADTQQQLLPQRQRVNVPLSAAFGRRRVYDSPAALAFTLNLCLGIEIHAYVLIRIRVYVIYSCSTEKCDPFLPAHLFIRTLYCTELLCSQQCA